MFPTVGDTAASTALEVARETSWHTMWTGLDDVKLYEEVSEAWYLI
jgi:hypothetical protein